MNLGGPELLIVLVVIILLFGAAKLPKLARSLGQAQSEFKSGLKEGSATTDDPAAVAEGDDSQTGEPRQTGQ